MAQEQQREITQLLDQIQHGNAQAASQLLPLVYDELRRLAAARMTGEKPGHTLDGTALVHEAYLRLCGDRPFASRTHFMRAAVTAMRRILVDHARAKRAEKRGGQAMRVSADDLEARPASDALDLDDALMCLQAEDPLAAQIVEFHHFAGLSHDQVAEILGLTVYQARQKWTYARAWLKAKLADS